MVENRNFLLSGGDKEHREMTDLGEEKRKLHQDIGSSELLQLLRQIQKQNKTKQNPKLFRMAASVSLKNQRPVFHGVAQ